jgi:hypothetical protein
MKFSSGSVLSLVLLAACGQQEETRDCLMSASYRSKIEQNGDERITYEGGLCLNGASLPAPDMLELEVDVLANSLETSVEGFTRTGTTTFETQLPSEQRHVRIEFTRPVDGREIPAQLMLRLRVREESR